MMHVTQFCKMPPRHCAMDVKYKENGVREVVLKEGWRLRVVHHTVHVTLVDQSSAGYAAMFD